MPNKKPKPKVKRVLLEGRSIDFENLMVFFERLTGRKPTPEEREEARKRWEQVLAEEKSH